MTLSPKALAKWRWLPGMRGYRPGSQNALTPFRVTDDDDCASFAGCIPDLTDPVTADSLPRMVRAAWGSVVHSVEYGKATDTLWWNGFFVTLCFGDGPARAFYGNTETEAWIAALEAAP